MQCHIVAIRHGGDGEGVATPDYVHCRPIGQRQRIGNLHCRAKGGGDGSGEMYSIGFRNIKNQLDRIGIDWVD